MMKRMLLFLITTLILFIFSRIESKGQCASGFTPKVVRLTIGNCDYDVTVCYKCAVSFPGEVYIRQISEVDSSCNNGLPIDQIIAQTYAEISTGHFIYSNLCVGGLHNAPPCDEGYSQFTVMHQYCWQVRYRFNGVENIYEYIPCENNAECTELIDFCYDGSNYIKINSVLLDGPQDPPCELQLHQITIPTVLNDVSECFILNYIPCGIE